MRRLIIFLVALTVGFPAWAFGADLTASQILQKVAEAYKNLKSFRVVVGKRELVTGTSGKVRLTSGKMQVVSNGEVSWIYLSDVNEYEEVAAVPIRGTIVFDFDFPGDPRLMRQPLDPTLVRQARLRGEKTLRVGGHDVACYILTVGKFEKLWVDTTSFIFLRSEFNSPPDWDGQYWISSGGTDTLQINDLDLGRIPEGTFEFVPPSGAKRVSQFSAPPHPNKSGHHSEDAEILHSNFLYGSRAPDFTLPDTGGGKVPLEDFRRKIVVLEFWTSNCKPCQGELAAVQKLHDELKAQDVVFLGVRAEDQTAVQNDDSGSQFTFPVLLDSERPLSNQNPWAASVFQRYWVEWAPTTIVIDRKGKIAARYVGAGGETQLRKALNAAGLSSAAP